MTQKRFCCTICNDWCLKPYNGLCKKCDEKQITGHLNKNNNISTSYNLNYSYIYKDEK